VEGGSFTVASVGSAIHAASLKVRARLLDIAQKMDRSPLSDARLDAVTFADGQIRLTSDPSRAVGLSEAMRHAKLDTIDADASAAPGPERQKYATYTHSAVFAEVTVDQDLGTIRVPRIVTAIAGGRII